MAFAIDRKAAAGRGRRSTTYTLGAFVIVILITSFPEVTVPEARSTASCWEGRRSRRFPTEKGHPQRTIASRMAFLVFLYGVLGWDDLVGQINVDL
jgi:hypothetical protein